MGCFLGCFCSSKNAKNRLKTPQYDSNHYPCTPVFPTVTSTVIENQDNPRQVLVPQTRVNQQEEEKLSLSSNSKVNLKEPKKVSSGTRKKVTFDSYVKEYEHVWKITHESQMGCEKEVVIKYSIKPIKFVSKAESSRLSISGFPPNLRYRNRRESDDEDEGPDCKVSKLDEDEDEEEIEGCYDDEHSNEEYHKRHVQGVSASPCVSLQSSTKSSPTCMSDGYSDQMLDARSSEKRTTPVGFVQGGRDRAGFVHSVLNPVENTAQWRTVKMKETPLMKEEQKENFRSDLGVQQSSPKSKTKFDEPMNNLEVEVDAILSTWLDSFKTPLSEGTPYSSSPILTRSGVSFNGAHSVRTQRGRPSFGSFRVEELNRFSATSSPLAHSRSADERPAVGTVGVHWNERTHVDECASVSPFKGILNTTSKYREDKRVHWHSTPFEMRPERA